MILQTQKISNLIFTNLIIVGLKPNFHPEAIDGHQINKTQNSQKFQDHFHKI